MRFACSAVQLQFSLSAVSWVFLSTWVIGLMMKKIGLIGVIWSLAVFGGSAFAAGGGMLQVHGLSDGDVNSAVYGRKPAGEGSKGGSGGKGGSGSKGNSGSK